MAFLPYDEFDPLTFRMPDGPIPLRVEFNPERYIGQAELTRHEDGTITCTAEIFHNDWHDIRRLSLAPKLGVELTRRYADPWELTGVSVVMKNSNPQIPSYTVYPEDE